MKCEICNRGMAEGVTLYRVNEFGVLGIWRCPAHLAFDQEAALDPEVKKLINIIEGENRRKCREF